MPGIVLNTGYTAVNKTHTVLPCHSSGRKVNNKNKFKKINIYVRLWQVLFNKARKQDKGVLDGAVILHQRSGKVLTKKVIFV